MSRRRTVACLLLAVCSAVTFVLAADSAGPTIEITDQPYGEVRCSTPVKIAGKAQGSLSTDPKEEDFILVLDSSGSLASTDPYDFRLQGATALAHALTSLHRLAIVDFDSPESGCGATCDNKGTEVEACFLDPVLDRAVVDSILQSSEINRSGMTSFNGAARELLNAYHFCPNPITTYGFEAVECSDHAQWTLRDDNRIGRKMYCGDAARSHVETHVVWFTDGTNTQGCGLTDAQIAEIRDMDADGVTVDLVKLGSRTGSGQLNQLVAETMGQVITVSDAEDLVDAIMASIKTKIIRIDAFNESLGDLALSVHTSALPAGLATFTVDIAAGQLLEGVNLIRVEATDEEGDTAVAWVEIIVTCTDPDPADEDEDEDGDETPDEAPDEAPDGAYMAHRARLSGSVARERYHRIFGE